VRLAKLVRLTATPLAALGLIVAVPTVADASGPVFTVMNTSETPPDGVWFRNSPHTADTSRITGLGVYKNERVELQCYAWGDSVKPYNNTLWYKVANVSRPTVAGRANVGYLNAHYINDGKNANVLDAGVPQCKASSSPTPVNPMYNRSAAVAWAEAHAKDPQAYGAMCTWFVSNVLWAGGFPKSAQWTNSGRYTSAPGTIVAWRLPNFLSYFRPRYSTTQYDITANLHSNAVPQAEPGDLILYDWGKGEGISHVSFVVDIASGDYPEVSEMGQFDMNLLDAGLNKIVHIKSKYVKRGWTYSEVNHNWLQVKYPHMKAYLLHINGGYFAPNF
jgi:hypothetical protein